VTVVDHLLASLNTAPPWLVYLLVGVLAFGEAAAFIGLVLPGETALLLAGVAAAQGHLSLPTLLLVGGLAAVAGDSAGYEIGRFGGDRIRRSRLGRLIGEPRWQRSEEFVARRGPTAVLLGRWVGVLRALVPALAGVTRMPYGRFLLWNTIGGLTWSSTVLLLGYAAGSALSSVRSSLGAFGMVVTVVFAGVLLIRRRAQVIAAGRRAAQRIWAERGWPARLWARWCELARRPVLLPATLASSIVAALVALTLVWPSASRLS
jgi:membrane protein DedA with SNARE-associated domain